MSRIKDENGCPCCAPPPPPPQTCCWVNKAAVKADFASYGHGPTGSVGLWDASEPLIVVTGGPGTYQYDGLAISAWPHPNHDDPAFQGAFVAGAKSIEVKAGCSWPVFGDIEIWMGYVPYYPDPIGDPDYFVMQPFGMLYQTAVGFLQITDGINVIAQTEVTDAIDGNDITATCCLSKDLKTMSATLQYDGCQLFQVSKTLADPLPSDPNWAVRLANGAGESPGMTSDTYGVIKHIKACHTDLFFTDDYGRKKTVCDGCLPTACGVCTSGTVPRTWNVTIPGGRWTQTWGPDWDGAMAPPDGTFELKRMCQTADSCFGAPGADVGTGLTWNPIKCVWAYLDPDASAEQLGLTGDGVVVGFPCAFVPKPPRGGGLCPDDTFVHGTGSPCNLDFGVEQCCDLTYGFLHNRIISIIVVLSKRNHSIDGGPTTSVPMWGGGNPVDDPLSHPLGVPGYFIEVIITFCCGFGLRFLKKVDEANSNPFDCSSEFAGPVDVPFLYNDAGSFAIYENNVPPFSFWFPAPGNSSNMMRSTPIWGNAMPYRTLGFAPPQFQDGQLVTPGPGGDGGFVGGPAGLIYAPLQNYRWDSWRDGQAPEMCPAQAIISRAIEGGPPPTPITGPNPARTAASLVELDTVPPITIQAVFTP